MLGWEGAGECGRCEGCGQKEKGPNSTSEEPQAMFIPQFRCAWP